MSQAKYIEFNSEWHKTCCKCKSAFGAEKIEHLRNFFHKDSSNLDGFNDRCKKCACAIQADQFKKSDAISKRKKAYRAKYPGKYKAHIALSNAVASGKIKKLPCKECGKQNAEGHHPDYRKPLAVIWLCRPCHAMEHCREKR